MKELGFTTLDDIEKLRKECSDDAYALALCQLGGTDIDIITSTIAIQDLLTIFILREGGGEKGLEWMYEKINGPSPYNAVRARQVMTAAASLPFLNTTDNK